MQQGPDSAPLPVNALVLSGRLFVSLRKAGRGGGRRAPVFHAVTPYCRMALCSAEPGAGSGWAEPPAEQVTCPACLAALARIGRPAGARR